MPRDTLLLISSRVQKVKRVDFRVNFFIYMVSHVPER
jgi:hypothetical protein